MSNGCRDAVETPGSAILARPVVTLIATGGTIAGIAASATAADYTAGALAAGALVAAVPQLAELAELRVEQLFNLDSKDMGPEHWLALARRVRAVLADPAVAGVVVTHGTDTLEETAFFLALAVDAEKPVVLTAAMRAATALSADGPRNLYDAVDTAAAPASRGRGVLVAIGGHIFAARGLRKAHTHRLAAFSGPHGGALGETAPVRFFHPPAPPPPAVLDPDAVTALPEVAVLYVAAGCAPLLLEAALQAGARGVVLVLPGNGSLPASWDAAVARASAAGVPVIRASRTGAGAVSPREEDRRCGCLAAGELPPSQARVAAMAALADADPGRLRALLGAH